MVYGALSWVRDDPLADKRRAQLQRLMPKLKRVDPEKRRKLAGDLFMWAWMSAVAEPDRWEPNLYGLIVPPTAPDEEGAAEMLQLSINGWMEKADARLQVVQVDRRLVRRGRYDRDIPNAMIELVEQALDEIANPPPQTYRACLTCGLVFTPNRSTAQYCSPACRAAAHRARA